MENPADTSENAVMMPSKTAIVFSGFLTSLNAYLTPIKYTDMNNNEKNKKSTICEYKW